MDEDISFSLGGINTEQSVHRDHDSVPYTSTNPLHATSTYSSSPGHQTLPLVSNMGGEITPSRLENLPLTLNMNEIQTSSLPPRSENLPLTLDMYETGTSALPSRSENVPVTFNVQHVQDSEPTYMPQRFEKPSMNPHTEERQTPYRTHMSTPVHDMDVHWSGLSTNQPSGLGLPSRQSRSVINTKDTSKLMLDRNARSVAPADSNVSVEALGNLMQQMFTRLDSIERSLDTNRAMQNTQNATGQVIIDHFKDLQRKLQKERQECEMFTQTSPTSQSVYSNPSFNCPVNSVSTTARSRKERNLEKLEIPERNITFRNVKSRAHQHRSNVRFDMPILEASTPLGKETDLSIPSNCSDSQSINTGNHGHNNYQQLTQPLVIRNVEDTPFHFQYGASGNVNPQDMPQTSSSELYPLDNHFQDNYPQETPFPPGVHQQDTPFHYGVHAQGPNQFQNQWFNNHPVHHVPDLSRGYLPKQNPVTSSSQVIHSSVGAPGPAFTHINPTMQPNLCNQRYRNSSRSSAFPGSSNFEQSASTTAGRNFTSVRPYNRKPATYDGSTSWKDHLVQFELVADLNQWTLETKALELAASLRGQAQSILSDLSPLHRKSYAHLIDALTERFEPENQMEIYRSQLKTRLRKKGEDLASLAQDLTKLVRKAYPTASTEMKGKFAMDAFIDALNDSDLEWSVYQGHPKTLQEASKLAHEYEAFRTGRSGKRGFHGGKIRFQRAEEEYAPISPCNQDLHADLLRAIKQVTVPSDSKYTQVQYPQSSSTKNSKHKNGDQPKYSRRGKCHFCKKDGHWINECKKDEKGVP